MSEMQPPSDVGAVKRNFILQQGLAEPSPASCPLQYSALLFQPRVIAVVVLAGALLGSRAIFLVLAAILWWSAVFPRWNPFDALYNRVVARKPGGLTLSPAPGPRRFAQGMAGAFALAIGFALIFGWHLTAIVLEVVLMLAVGALVFGSFCLGSFVFHLVLGRVAFARRTLPWARAG